MNRLTTLALAAALPLAAHAQQGTFSSRSLTPETALTAARAALEHCRKNGWQAAVAVVDRAGLTQALLRDRFAGAHTIDGAMNKAWTAASFRTPTTAPAAETQPGKPMSGVRRTTAHHLTHAWNTIPHVFQHDRADITGVEALRKRLSKKAEAEGRTPVTITAFLMKTLAAAYAMPPEVVSEAKSMMVGK